MPRNGTPTERTTPKSTATTTTGTTPSTVSIAHTEKQQWIAPHCLHNASVGKMAGHILKCHNDTTKCRPALGTPNTNHPTPPPKQRRTCIVVEKKRWGTSAASPQNPIPGHRRPPAPPLGCHDPEMATISSAPHAGPPAALSHDTLHLTDRCRRRPSTSRHSCTSSLVAATSTTPHQSLSSRTSRSRRRLRLATTAATAAPTAIPRRPLLSIPVRHPLPQVPLSSSHHIRRW